MSGRVEFDGWVEPTLSSDQKAVLDMILKDNEIPRRIALRRKTSIQAIYKIIKRIKKKGFLKGRFDGGVVSAEPLLRGGGLKSDTQMTLVSYGKHTIRLHGQEFNAKILFRTSVYERVKLQKSIKLQGNTIKLFHSSLEIYCNPAISFVGASPREALRSSQPYWDSLFREIEAKLGILIIKPGHTPLQVNAHYAELQNELADQAHKEEQLLAIVDPKDQKTWGKADFSKKEPELETIHPITALRDMQEVVQPFFNDLRDYYAQTGENLLLTSFLKGMNGLAANQAVFDANMKSHIAAVQELGKAVKELRETIKKGGNKDGK